MTATDVLQKIGETLDSIATVKSVLAYARIVLRTYDTNTGADMITYGRPVSTSWR